MSSKKEILSDLLKGLEEEGDVEGSAIVTRDGLLIASGLPEDIDSETFAAMSATMLGAAETAVCELKKDEVGIIIVEGKEAKLITRTDIIKVLIRPINKSFLSEVLRPINLL